MSDPIDSAGVSERENDEIQSSGNHARIQSSGSSDVARLEERLAALERQFTGGGPVSDLDGLAELDDRVTELEESTADLEETVDELSAAMQAVRGYVGSIRAVNREVERRADLALARAERIERHADPPAEEPAVPAPDAVAAAVPDDESAQRDGDEPSVDEDVLSRLRDAL